MADDVHASWARRGDELETRRVPWLSSSLCNPGLLKMAEYDPALAAVAVTRKLTKLVNLINVPNGSPKEMLAAAKTAVGQSALPDELITPELLDACGKLFTQGPLSDPANVLQKRGQRENGPTFYTRGAPVCKDDVRALCEETGKRDLREYDVDVCYA